MNRVGNQALVMGWAFLAEHDTTLALARAILFAARKPRHLRAQVVDLAILPGNDLRQVIDGADEMGQTFLDLGHDAGLRRACLPVNLAPARPLG